MFAPYRLGLLLCDHALPSLAARFCDYDRMIERAFAPLQAPLQWQIYDVTAGQLPADDDDCDGYLLSGSRHGTGDALPWIAPLEAWIRRLRDGQRPLVGLCFGHQLMAQALGGAVGRADAGWGLGIQDYEVASTQAWMSPSLPRFALPVCHADQVQRLPRDATCLASSAHCAHFLVGYAPHMLGLQGHPEFEPAFLAALIETRRASLPAARVHSALASLTTSHDSVVVTRWLAQFLGIPIAPSRALQGDPHD